jgi:universal stress protein E
MKRDRELMLYKLIAGIDVTTQNKVSIKKLVGVGKDYLEVIKKAADSSFDLVVKVASSGGGLTAKLFGSIDIKLLHYCACLVMILKPSRRKSWDVLMAAVDPRADSSESSLLNSSLLNLTTSISETESAHVHVVHVLEKPVREAKYTAINELKQLESSLKADVKRKMSRLVENCAHISMQEHLLKGSPRSAITNFVKKHEVDLLVMGSVASPNYS